MSLHPSARITPGVVVYRLDDRLFFANANYVHGRVQEAIGAAPTETRWLVFDAESVTHVDSTGMEALADLAGDSGAPGSRSSSRGCGTGCGRVRARRRYGGDRRRRFYPSVERAVAAFVGPPPTAAR